MKTKIKNILKRLRINKRDIAWVFCILSCLYFYTVGIPTTADYLSESMGLDRIQKPVPLVAKEEVKEEPYDWMKRQWIEAGASWEEVWAIVQCESTWNQEAVNVNTNGSIDRGLYQLNSIHKINPSCAFNLECSTQEAIKLWKKQGWTPWTCKKRIGL